eukprot:CAMPEP_0172608142 /NCGR_PEP_ID=MMETSP1068-20121228/28253_1 /TAXON_ID=35684 /ORGANISM="Pseudopedinella elastica, Strain CCMP716" /LENGTH=196 /DNA_ID=CAMNT_0013411313 /DNA_START=139 /DNA_END=724 /DNA_ORIENTATION=-
MGAHSWAKLTGRPSWDETPTNSPPSLRLCSIQSGTDVSIVPDSTENMDLISGPPISGVRIVGDVYRPEIDFVEVEGRDPVNDPGWVGPAAARGDGAVTRGGVQPVHLVHVFVSEGQNDARDQEAVLQAQTPHHPVIDQAQLAIREHQDVSGVWIRVVDSVKQQLRPVHLHEVLELLAKIQACGRLEGRGQIRRESR